MRVALVTVFEIRSGKREQFDEAWRKMTELLASIGVPEPRLWRGFIAGPQSRTIFVVMEFESMTRLSDFYTKTESNDEYGAWARREHGPDGSMKLLGRYLLDELGT